MDILVSTSMPSLQGEAAVAERSKTVRPFLSDDTIATDLDFREEIASLMIF